LSWILYIQVYKGQR